MSIDFEKLIVGLSCLGYSSEDHANGIVYCFWVNDSNTIFSDIEDRPETPREFHGLPDKISIDDIGVFQELDSRACDFLADHEKDDLDELTPDEKIELLEELEDYADGDLSSEEFDQMDTQGISAQGSAFSFFEDQDELRNLLNVSIIDSDRPGSNYLAAELDKPIEDANKILQDHNLPICFKQGEPNF